MTGKPLRVSWSAIRAHEQCKQKSFLVREGKRAKVSNTRNFLHGTVVDSIMRVWLDNPLHPAGAMAAMVDELIEQTLASEKTAGNIVRWRNADDRQTVRTFCVELVNRLEPILTEHVLPYPYEHGKWFKVPMQIDGHDILLTGEMDLLVDNDGPVIWDLKGTADDQYYRKVIAQLTFYDIAVWALTGRKSRHVGLIQPMCNEQLLAWQVTDEARRNLMIRIQLYVRDVLNREQTCTTDRAVCHWCDVKHACPRFSTDALGSLAEGLRKAAGETA